MTERSDRSMEAASSSTGSLEDFVNSSILRMDSQERNLSDTARSVQALVAQVSELTQQFQRLRGSTAPPTPPVPLPPPENPSQSEPRLPVPESYTGEPNYCRAFLTRCSMQFSLQPRTFNNERAKVAFVLTLLTGRAALWGTAVWENQDPCCASFQDLSAEMRWVFDRAVAGREAARMLADLRQGERSVSDFSIESHTAQSSHRRDRGSTVWRRGHGQPCLRSRAHAGGASSTFPGGKREAEVPGPLHVLWRRGSFCL